MTIVIDYINKATYIDVESTQVPLSSHDIMIYFCKQTYQNLSESVHSERPENRVGLPLPWKEEYLGTSTQERTWGLFLNVI